MLRNGLLQNPERRAEADVLLVKRWDKGQNLAQVEVLYKTFLPYAVYSRVGTGGKDYSTARVNALNTSYQRTLSCDISLV